MGRLAVALSRRAQDSDAFDESCGDARNYCVPLHIPANDSASGDNGIIANAYSWQHNCACAEPDVFA